MPLLSVENLSYNYPNGVRALDGVSFCVETTDCVGLVGGNGAGKSTLLLILCGLITPDSGVITIDGVALKKENLALIRNMIGMVFQNPDDQLFMPTIYEDVAFGLQHRGYAPEVIDQKVRETLRHLHIEHLAERPPFRLSGGEKRSAAIATVLSMEPHLMLFDEPTAFLDPRSKRNFIHLLRSMSAARIVTTHDIDLVSRACNRVLVLKEGRLLSDDTPERVFADERLLDEAGL